jgi:hypothetical protein
MKTTLGQVKEMGAPERAEKNGSTTRSVIEPFV